MTKREQENTDSFEGKMTEKGKKAYGAIIQRFSGQSKVTLDELSDFLRDELGEEKLVITILFGGVTETMEHLGFEPWVERTWQETKRFGRIPGVPKWRGYKRVED